MAGSTHVHDRALLDALERVAAAPFAGDVWRTTWAGRDALRGSSSEGRWIVPGLVEVLYTSLQRAASLAEVGYRLSLEPVWPSRAEHVVHKLAVKTESTLRLATFADLLPLGIDPALYPTLDYARTKAIAAAARFLEFDGLLVPSARHPSMNLVLFVDQLMDDSLMVMSSEPVDWTAWRAGRG